MSHNYPMNCISQIVNLAPIGMTYFRTAVKINFSTKSLVSVLRQLGPPYEMKIERPHDPLRGLTQPPSYQNTAWNPLKPHHWQRFKPPHVKERDRIYRNRWVDETNFHCSPIMNSDSNKDRREMGDKR